MAVLNRCASELMIEAAAHACTNVTGFGLAGHLTAMAAAGGVDVEVVWDDLPLLPGVLQCMADDVVPGAAERNREAAEGRIAAAAGLLPAMLDICFDPQTSGGLLIAVAGPAAERLLSKLREAGCAEAAVIGRAVAPGKGQVIVRHAGRRFLPSNTALANCREAHASSPPLPPGEGRGEGNPAEIPPFASDPGCNFPSPQPFPGGRGGPGIGDSQDSISNPSNLPQEANAMSCCSDDRSKETPSPGKPAESRQKFQDFLHAAGAPGRSTGGRSRRWRLPWRCWPNASRA